MRTCELCGLENPLPRARYCSKSCGKKAAYWAKPEKYRAAATAWGNAHPERKQEAVKRFAERHPDANRRGVLRRYNMTPESYEVLLAKQQYCCAACGAREPGKGRKHFDIDHDHSTAIVRGLLCVTCNRGLGMFEDNPERLLAAHRYLTERRASCQ